MEKSNFNFSIANLEEQIEIPDGVMPETPNLGVVDESDKEEVIEEKEEKQPEKKADSKEELEVEVETDTTKDKGHKEEDIEDTDAKSPLAPFAAALVEDGILSIDLDEFNKLETAEEQATALLEAQRNTIDEGIDKGVTEWVDSLPDLAKRAIDAIVEGVPLEKVLNSISNIDTFSRITDKELQDENTQKQIYGQYLKTKGFDDKKIERMITKSVDTDSLLEDAKDALEELKVYESKYLEQEKEVSKKREEQKQESYKVYIRGLQESIEETNEIIPGVKFNKQTKQNIFESMTKIVGNDSNGRPVNIIGKIRDENPIEFDKKLHYYATLGLFDKKPKFDKIFSIGKSKAVQELVDMTRAEKGFKTGKSAQPISGGAKNLLTAIKTKFT